MLYQFQLAAFTEKKNYRKNTVNGKMRSFAAQNRSAQSTLTIEQRRASAKTNKFASKVVKRKKSGVIGVWRCTSTHRVNRCRRQYVNANASNKNQTEYRYVFGIFHSVVRSFGLPLPASMSLRLYYCLDTESFL